MNLNAVYVESVVAFHSLREKTKDSFGRLQEANIAQKFQSIQNHANRTLDVLRGKFVTTSTQTHQQILDNYSHIFRRKNRWELVLLSGAVCGIEFCYAAETAFVTPTLLSLGLDIQFMTMIWCLSPLVGFFLTPLLGSLSDSCESNFGRRRPFIILLSFGILLGLVLVPNGHSIGIALGDKGKKINYPYNTSTQSLKSQAVHNLTNIQLLPDSLLRIVSLKRTGGIEPLSFDESHSKFFLPTTHISSAKLIIINPVKSKNQLHTTNSKYNPARKNLFNKEQKISSLEDFDYLNGDDKKVNGVFLIFPINSKPQSPSQQQTKDLNNNYSSLPISAQLAINNSTLIEPSRVLNTNGSHTQPWSILFTILGTVLLDFCSDACQSPARTYLLDVTIPEDHATGLSTFTMMAGLGGSIGYLMGGIDWEATFLGSLLGGHVRAVFTIVTILFIICLLCTISSFPEIPLHILRNPSMLKDCQANLCIGKYHKFEGDINEDVVNLEINLPTYGTMDEAQANCLDLETKPKNILNDMNDPTYQNQNDLPASPIIEVEHSTITYEQPTLKQYLLSIWQMPKSLRILCLTNLFCWMSLVCYSLYFTDFVGECVYGGDPREPEGSTRYRLYEAGVRFGCWGMAVYSISCSFYSYCIESLVKTLGAKPVYIGGQLAYTVGMIIMALCRHPVAVILLSPTAGIMYATLFTMPYILVAHYHCLQMFEEEASCTNPSVRGMGTDVAIVGSMVFLSQFVLSLTMGSIVAAVGSSVATVCAAAILSACGALCATQILYLDL